MIKVLDKIFAPFKRRRDILRSYLFLFIGCYLFALLSAHLPDGENEDLYNKLIEWGFVFYGIIFVPLILIKAWRMKKDKG